MRLEPEAHHGLVAPVLRQIATGAQSTGGFCVGKRGFVSGHVLHLCSLPHAHRAMHGRARLGLAILGADAAAAAEGDLVEISV